MRKTCRSRVVIFEQVWKQDRFFQGGQGLLQLRHNRAPVKGLAIILIAIDSKKHLRLYLFEAIDDAARTEVRRTTRPDSAHARAGKKRYQGLRDIGHIGYYPVAALHSHSAQSPGHCTRLPAQLIPGDLDQFMPLGTE